MPEEYTDEELEAINEAHSTSGDKRTWDEDMPLRLLRKLHEEHGVDLEKVELEGTWTCGNCGDTFYNLEMNEAIPEDMGTCRICGWEECLSFDDYGYRTHPEYVESYMVVFGDEDPTICYGCRESFSHHPDGTVHLMDPEHEIEFKGNFIGNYLEDLGRATGETVAFDDLPERDQKMIEEVIKGTYYKSTDAWRGHRETDTEGEYAVKLHSDTALAYSKDEQDLKKFDDAVKELLSRWEIPYIRLMTTTSNIFAQGYDLFMYADTDKPVDEAIEKLKDGYRDPHQFRMTALTGKDPEDWDEKDEVLNMVASILEIQEA